METKNLYGHIVCYNFFKYNTFNNLKVFLEGADFKSICENLAEKTVIVLGGDGTMLKAINTNYKLGFPFLGINFGNKGFLLNSKDYINKNSKFEKRFYPIMKAEVFTEKHIYKDIFFNEININAGIGRMLDLNIIIGGNKNINIKGDGIVISTPAGSTGYNSSLRGPIIPHNLETVVITPKAPWFPRGQHPILLSDNQQIEIKNVGRNYLLEVYCDGRSLVTSKEENISIKVEKSKHKVAFLIDLDYKNIWDNKIYLEQGFE